jgi:hypothetical protein
VQLTFLQYLSALYINQSLLFALVQEETERF